MTIAFFFALFLGGFCVGCGVLKAGWLASQTGDLSGLDLRRAAWQRRAFGRTLGFEFGVLIRAEQGSDGSTHRVGAAAIGRCDLSACFSSAVPLHNFLLMAVVKPAGGHHQYRTAFKLKGGGARGLSK